jgi:hypothetical protein
MTFLTLGGYTGTLKQYLPLTGNATDQTSNGNDGTLVHAPVSTTGQVAPTANGAYDLDGANDYIDTNYHISSHTPFTIMFWVNVDDLTISSRQDFWGTGATNDCDFRISIQTDEKVQVLIRGDGATTSVTLEGTTDISDQAWHHIAIVYNGSDIYLYVDGSQEDTDTVDFSTNGFNMDRDAYFGCRNDNSSASNFFDGKVDDLRIYSEALSLATINAERNSALSKEAGNWCEGFF